jgi:4-hydroxy-4-methyl-2-oxoglutarate aldolase
MSRGRICCMVGLLIALACGLFAQGWAAEAKPAAQSLITSPERVMQYTPSWQGERMADGRPFVSDELLKRLKYVSVTEAWEAIRNSSPNCFEGPETWRVMRPDEVICGRVLTAQFMPARSDLNNAILTQGKQVEGRIGDSNSWPIDMLKKGDVYVADGFGKVIDGTLIGDNLGNAIYANSGNGVIFNAGVRDLAGLEDIKGFNAWHKGSHPSFLQSVMLTGINVPIRIGNAIVMPGDIVIAKRDGMVFIPPQQVQAVLNASEPTRVHDAFGHLRLTEGKYTPGQIDGAWGPDITADYTSWVKENRDKLIESLHVGAETIDNIISGRGGRGGGRGARAGAGGTGARGPALP